MKKQLLLGALLLTATSAMADPIDLQKAKSIAAEYLTENTAEPMLVKRAERDMTKARRLPAKTAQAAPYYIFSRGEGQGFVIVSGDDCLPDVLGYTESGDFIEDQMPPQLLGWLDAWAKSIEETQLRGENVSRSSDARKANYTAGGIRKAAADRVDVPVLLTSQWSQNWPYNSWCPYVKNTTTRAVTGCVATAGAQVLYYFRKDLPDLLGATTPTYDWCDAPVTQSIPKGTPMKWGLMLDSYPGNLPEEYYDAIGVFHLVVGAYTWMGYGYSSGAYIENLCPTYNDCFNVASKNIWAGHSTLQNLAYADLIQKRPVVYAGYDTNNGGHAIVIDGYRARDDKYHFNFGWGGTGPESGGNGWYIMEDEGVGGYGFNPSITYDIHPKNINVQATISTPQGFYANHENKVRVTLKNKSTFPLEGVYLFYETTAATPTDIQKAKSSQEIVVPNDGSTVDVYLKAKPTAAKNYYLTVTDEKLNVLAREKFEAVSVGNDLLFQSISILGTNETETHNDHNYTVVNGDHITCLATVLNRSDMSYQESPRVQVLVSEDDGVTFTSLGAKSAYNVNIEPHEIGEFWFTINPTSTMPLQSGKLYAVTLMQPLTIRTQTTLTYETTDTMAFFTLRDSEGMQAELNGTTLTFTGSWNAYEFEDLVKKNGDDVLVYDLSGVQGVGRVPELKGKEYNMILVGADATVTGVNVISVDPSNAHADRLSLAVGHDFVFDKPIIANSASLTLNITPNEWHLITVPCNMPLPNGIFAKRIDSYTSAGISNQTTNVTELEAGQTYLLMTSSNRHQQLTATSAAGVKVMNAPATNVYPPVTASDFTVLNEPVENVCSAVKGSFVTTTVTPDENANVFYLDNDYFRLVSGEYQVNAFGGYFVAEDVTRAFRSNSNVMADNAYNSLGKAIADVYDIYDQYADYVKPEACEQLLQKLAEAEAIFTSREMEQRDDVINLTKMLREMAEEFKGQLDGEALTSELDVTSLLINPSFERGSTAASNTGSTYGWTVGSDVRVRNNSDYNYRAVGADGNYFVYSGTGSPVHGLGISQIVETLPKGVYALTAMVGTEPGSTVTIFANDCEQTVDASVSGQYYLREARIDEILIREGDNLTVGIRDCDNWYKADDFHLYFVRNLTPEEDVPTGIEVSVMDKVQGSNVIYDITGRRVTTPTRGLYIIDGKKVLVK